LFRKKACSDRLEKQPNRVSTTLVKAIGIAFFPAEQMDIVIIALPPVQGSDYGAIITALRNAKETLSAASPDCTLPPGDPAGLLHPRGQPIP
jgi:hypothetical protein